MSAWHNADHEGHVEPGQEFETSEYRAAELARVGLAVYAMPETAKVKVTADPPPPEPDPKPPPPPAASPRKAPAKRKSR
jgi:hypothetical protein